MQIKRLLITGSEWKKLREWLLETKGYQSSSFIQLRNSDLEPNFFNVNCPVDECLVISIQVSAVPQSLTMLQNMEVAKHMEESWSKTLYKQSQETSWQRPLYGWTRTSLRLSQYMMRLFASQEKTTSKNLKE